MIIGVSGIAGSGKSVFANFLVEDHGFEVLSLADPLKRICREVFDFTEEQLWGPSEKRNEPDPRYPREDGTYLSARQALQLLGTEFGRACYPNVWVEYAIRMARKIEQNYYLHSEPRSTSGTKVYQGRYYKDTEAERWIAIPDVRFRNEIDGIRQAGGKLVRIRRPGAGLSGAAGVHASEAEQASIPDDVFDLVIENNGTLEELRAKAAAALPILRP